MIRSICLNPNIDRTYFIENFRSGKQYKGNSPLESVGGKGINVAKVCWYLKEPAVVYGFTGGYTGRNVSSAMKKFCPEMCLIEIDGETRQTINIIDRSCNLETEIVEKGPLVTPENVASLLNHLEGDLQAGDIVICSGISIPGAPEDIYAQISGICRKKEASCILDSNGESLKNSFGGHYFMCKPNQNELAEMCKSSVTCDPAALCRMARDMKQNSFEYVLVSTGKEGGLFVGDSVCYRASVPQVNVVSTIGCGDASVAGFAVGMRRGLPLKESLRLSMACGVANSMNPQIAQIDLDTVQRLVDEIRITDFAG